MPNTIISCITSFAELRTSACKVKQGFSGSWAERAVWWGNEFHRVEIRLHRVPAWHCFQPNAVFCFFATGYCSGNCSTFVTTQQLANKNGVSLASCFADIGRDKSTTFRTLWLGALSRGMEILHSRAEVRTWERALIDRNANFCGPGNACGSSVEYPISTCSSLRSFRKQPVWLSSLILTNLT